MSEGGDARSPERRRGIRSALVLALLLGLAASGAAVRVLVWEPELSPAAELLITLTRNLVTLQRPGGDFDPYPDQAEQPQVRRTGPHALAAAALGRARSLGFARHVPDLVRAHEAAIRVLVDRQQAGGTFGSMPPGVRNPWPGVDATSAGVLALTTSEAALAADALVAATAALARSAEYGLRDGWTRALAALALDRARAAGALAAAGGDLAALLPVSPGEERIDCGDYRLAEAIVRRVRALPPAYGDRVLGACTEEGPEWTGQNADLQAWLLQAWLAARSPAGRLLAEALLGALEEAILSPPEGRIPGGWYADAISQSACGVLALAELVQWERDGEPIRLPAP